MTYTTVHAVKFILFCIALALSLFTLTATDAQAYFTTDQRTVDLGNHTGLFLIDYTFGTEKHEIHMPIKVLDSDAGTNDAVSFSMIDRNGDEARGTAVGIVLSNAKLNSKGVYVTPKGIAKKFTLAVFFTPETSDSGEKYRLQVTHLPFKFDGAQQLKLNPSELQYYTTKQLPL